MAFSVSTEHFNLGNVAAVLNQVTGDGSTQAWQTGLSKVFFYIASTADDTHCITDKWFLNYSDAGTTAVNGYVHTDNAAPDDGEVWYCFGIGRP